MGLSMSGSYSRLAGLRAKKINTLLIVTPSLLGSYLAGESANIRLWATNLETFEVKVNFTITSGNLPAGFVLTDSPTENQYAYLTGTFPSVSQNTTYTFTVKAMMDFGGGITIENSKTFTIYQNHDNLLYYWNFNKSVNSHDGTATVGGLTTSSGVNFTQNGGSSRRFLTTSKGFAFGGPTYSVSSTLDFMNTSDFTIETYFLAHQGVTANTTLFSINGNQCAVNFAAPASDNMPVWAGIGHATSTLDNSHNFGGLGLKTERWNHLALVRHNDQLKIYMNGKSNGTSLDLSGKTLISHTGDYSSFTRLSMGANNDVKVYDAGQGGNVISGTFSGLFAEFKIYNKAVYPTDFYIPWGNQMPASWGSQSSDTDTTNWNGWQFANWNN